MAGLENFAAFGTPKSIPNTFEYDEIGKADPEQERGGNECSDNVATNLKDSNPFCIAVVVAATTNATRTTTVEWPSEKNSRPKAAFCRPASACERHCLLPRYDRHRRRGEALRHKRARPCPKAPDCRQKDAKPKATRRYWLRRDKRKSP